MMAPDERDKRRVPTYTTTVAFATPWFSVLERCPADSGASYFAVQPRDYCSALAVTPASEIVLVEQYRPVVEKWTLELPSGTVDAGETAEAAMLRELREETGYRAVSLTLLGEVTTDTGRLCNRLHAFFAVVEPDPDRLWPTDDEWSIRTVVHSREQLLSRMVAGEPAFDNALHLSVLQLAAFRGCFDVLAR